MLNCYTNTFGSATATAAALVVLASVGVDAHSRAQLLLFLMGKQKIPRRVRELAM